MLISCLKQKSQNTFPYHVNRVYKFVIKSRLRSILCYNFHLVCLKLWRTMKLLLPLLLAVFISVQLISYAEARHHHEVVERESTNSSDTEQKGLDDKVLKHKVGNEAHVDEVHHRYVDMTVTRCEARRYFNLASSFSKN